MIIYENQHKRNLKEKYLTTISKKDLNNNLRLLHGWGLKDSFLEVFKLPVNQDELRSSFLNTNVIRIGCVPNKDILIWNGEVLHAVIEFVINVSWDLALTYQKNNDFIELSSRYNPDVEVLKEYLKTDEYYQSYFKQILKQFKDIKYLKNKVKTNEIYRILYSILFMEK